MYLEFFNFSEDNNRTRTRRVKKTRKIMKKLKFDGTSMKFVDLGPDLDIDSEVIYF